MDVKLIFLDLDGTLLDSRKQISKKNYDTLARAAAHGIHIVPCTGRFYNGIPENVRALPFVRYVVTVNGAQILDTKTGQALVREEIAPEQAERVYDRLDALPVIYDCFVDGAAYMDARFYAQIDDYITEPSVRSMVKALRQPVPDFRGLMRSRHAPVQKIQMFFRDQTQRHAAWAALAQVFPELNVTSSISNNVELTAKRANKGDALRFLCRLCRAQPQQALAFGDSDNDRPMLEAGFGVAMANADEALLRAADYVTASNDEDGVAAAIVHFCTEISEAGAGRT